MSNDNVTKLIQPGGFDDPLTEILRNGARALLAKAVEAEVADFLGKHADLKTQDGHQRVVRHGHLPEREVMTGIGPVAVCQPRVRDREAAADPDCIRFSPSILPPYMRRSKSIETLLAFYDFPAEHWKHLRTTDEMDKRFFMTEMTIAEIAYVHSFVWSRRGAILPSRPPISQPPRAGAVKAGRVCGHRKAWP